MLSDPAYGGQAEIVEALLTALNKTVLNIELAKRGQSVVGKQREGLHLMNMLVRVRASKQSSHQPCPYHVSRMGAWLCFITDV